LLTLAVYLFIRCLLFLTPSILVLEDIFDCDTVFKTQL
jgi:hypothetical protein